MSLLTEIKSLTWYLYVFCTLVGSFARFDVIMCSSVCEQLMKESVLWLNTLKTLKRLMALLLYIFFPVSVCSDSRIMNGITTRNLI